MGGLVSPDGDSLRSRNSSQQYPEGAIGFVELLRFVNERDDLLIFAWRVMSNHDHLVMCASTESPRQEM